MSAKKEHQPKKTSLTPKAPPGLVSLVKSLTILQIAGWQEVYQHSKSINCPLKVMVDTDWLTYTSNEQKSQANHEKKLGLVRGEGEKKRPRKKPTSKEGGQSEDDTEDTNSVSLLQKKEKKKEKKKKKKSKKQKSEHDDHDEEKNASKKGKGKGTDKSSKVASAAVPPAPTSVEFESPAEDTHETRTKSLTEFELKAVKQLKQWGMTFSKECGIVPGSQIYAERAVEANPKLLDTVVVTLGMMVRNHPSWPQVLQRLQTGLNVINGKHRHVIAIAAWGYHGDPEVTRSICNQWTAKYQCKPFTLPTSVTATASKATSPLQGSQTNAGTTIASTAPTATATATPSPAMRGSHLLAQSPKNQGTAVAWDTDDDLDTQLSQMTLPPTNHAAEKAMGNRTPGVASIASGSEIATPAAMPETRLVDALNRANSPPPRDPTSKRKTFHYSSPFDNGDDDDDDGSDGDYNIPDSIH